MQRVCECQARYHYLKQLRSQWGLTQRLGRRKQWLGDGQHLVRRIDISLIHNARVKSFCASLRHLLGDPRYRQGCRPAHSTDPSIAF